MSDSAPAIDQPASPAGPGLLREALLTFVIATLFGAFWQVNPGFARYKDASGGSEWLWQRSPGMARGDSPYHIRMAYLYRTGEMFEAGPNFHWTRLSVWNGHFSDKDFLYHLYLIPFTFFAQDEYDHGGLLQGAKISVAVATGLLALGLLAALRLLGVRQAWPFVLLMGAIAWVFIFRTTEARSWFMSTICALIGWAAISRGKRGLTFVVGVFYVLAYTAAHILLLLAVFNLVGRLILGPEPGARRKAELWRNATVLGAAVLGIVAGWALHPQPVETLQMWWVQNVLVPHLHGGNEISGGMAAISQSVLGWEKIPPGLKLPQELFGAELNPPGLRMMLIGSNFALLIPLVLVGLAFAARWRPNRTAILTLMIAIGLSVLIARSLRFVEYAIPFVVLAAGVWITGMAGGAKRLFVTGRARKVWRRVGLGAISLGMLAQATVINQTLNYTHASYFPAMVDWLSHHDEVRGKLIYNLAWDSFPELFMVRSDCDYAAGLDPAFVVAAGNPQSQAFIQLALGNVGYVASDGPGLVKILREQMRADYVFVEQRVNPVMYDGYARMARAGLLQELVYDDGDADDPFDGYALYRVPR